MMDDNCKNFARQFRDFAKVLGADKFTLYINDPWWPGEMRLYDRMKLDYPEPMFGFLEKTAELERVLGGKAVEFWEDSERSPTLRESPETHLDRLAAEIARDEPLYGDFVRRERVKSTARLIINDGASILAVIFLNYLQPTKERDIIWKNSSRIDDFCVFVRESYPKLSRYIMQSETSPLPAQKLALSAVHELVSMADCPANELKSRMERTIQCIIDDVLRLCELQDDGFGTFHLVNSVDNTIDLVVASGAIALDESNKAACCRLDLKAGQGVVTWVALRNKPVVINNMGHSLFKNIYVPIVKDEMLSEIAVPVRMGEGRIGVLNFEHRKKNALPKHRSTVLRTIVQVAKVAGMAYLFCDKSLEASTQAQRTRDLLHICSEVPNDPRKAVNGLARIAATQMRADWCDLFAYNRNRSEFLLVGSSRQESDSLSGNPRCDKGFTKYMYDSRELVWITRRDPFGDCDFDDYYWNGQSKHWTDRKRHQCTRALPEKLNGDLVQDEVQQELGVPLVGYDGVLAVVWIKYKSGFRSMPSAVEIESALQLLNGQGFLILEAMQNTSLRSEIERNRGLAKAIQLLRHEAVAKVLESFIRRRTDQIDAQHYANTEEEVRAELYALEYLKTYVENMLRFSELSEDVASRIETNRQACKLRNIVADAIVVADVFLSLPKCINLVQESIGVCLDIELIRFTLVNLLQNAKKFTPSEKKRSESISVTAEIIRRDSKSFLYITVTNAGYGELTDEQINQIGTRGKAFHQGGKQIAGSGLGVYMCRLIAKCHGGDLVEKKQNERGGLTISFSYNVTGAR